MLFLTLVSPNSRWMLKIKFLVGIDIIHFLTIKAIYDFQLHKDLSELLQVVEEISQGEWEGMQKKTRSTEPSKYQNPFQVIFDNRLLVTSK